MLNHTTDTNLFQTLQDIFIAATITLMWLFAPTARRREKEMASTFETHQSKCGDLRQRRFPKYVWRTAAGPEPQGILNRRRRQFVNTLAPDHPLRKRSKAGTGHLLPTEQQPPPRPRDTSPNPDVLRGKGKTKSRLDSSSVESILERSHLLHMWNGITERVVKEEEWQQFDRVKPKLLTLKRKYSYVDMYLEDEATLERKRARSRHRAERERFRKWKESCNVISEFLAKHPDDEQNHVTCQQQTSAKETHRRALAPRTLSPNIISGASAMDDTHEALSKPVTIAYQPDTNRRRKRTADLDTLKSPSEYALQEIERLQAKHASLKGLPWPPRRLDSE